MRLFLGFAILVAHASSAFSISESDVVTSAIHHFPKVLESAQKQLEAENKVTESLGAFDAQLKGQVDARTEGYYEGDAYKILAEKPLRYFNSKIYGGYRQSFGDFPVYEGKLETLDGGETFAGFSVSLLRNALIDQERYKLRNQEQNFRQSKIDLEITKVNVQTMALKAYWSWVLNGYKLKTYKNILALARSRASQIKKRIRVGDLARIYEAENNQYIRKREAQVAQSTLDFQKASFYLSLFYRNSQGTPIPLSPTQVPDLPNQTLQPALTSSSLFSTAMSRNLNLKRLLSQNEQAELDIKLGKNQYLPKVDLNFEWNQDQGVGPNRLEQDENRILLSVEVPIQYRKARGMKNAGKAKQDQIETKIKWLKDQVGAQSQSLVAELTSYAEMYNLTKDQVTLADKLANAERRKFSEGASDLILVNIREENLAEAQIKNLLARLKYEFTEAEIMAFQFQLITDNR